IAPDHTPHVGDLKFIVGVSYSSYTRPGAARVQRCQAGGRRPVRKPGRRVPPEATAAPCSAPPTMRRWSSSQLVITTRKISSIEFGKSESHPPVQNPTSPHTLLRAHDTIA